MQRKVLASAVALGLSVSLATVPVADAAQTGAKDDLGFCSVRLTDAEQRYFDQAIGDLKIEQIARDAATAVEAVYPQFKSPADALFREPVVREFAEAIVKDEEPSWDRQLAFYEIQSKEADRFKDEQTADAYLSYIEVRSLSEFPEAAAAAGLEEELEFFSISEVYASRDSYQTGDLAGSMADDLGIPQSKIADFRNGFAKTRTGKTLPALQEEYGAAMTGAQTACADGGKRDVKFPTAKTTKTDQTKPGDKAGDKATDNAKNNGSSEDTGKIIGIIAGVLVALGLIAGGVVAFAPQLGITLPF